MTQLLRPTGHTSACCDTRSYAEGTAATSVAPAATLDSRTKNAAHQTGRHHDTPQNTLKMMEAAAVVADFVANRRRMCPRSTAESAIDHPYPPQEEEEAAAVPVPAASAEEP